MNKLLILIIIILVIVVSGIFIRGLLKGEKNIQSKPVPLESYKFDGSSIQCSFSYGVDGTGFGVTADIVNTGSKLVLPSTAWLVYDGQVCDKKKLDKEYPAGSVLFKDNDGGRWFKCSADLPGIPKEAEEIDKTFKLVYAKEGQDPINDGVVIYSGKTKGLCRVAVE